MNAAVRSSSSTTRTLLDPVSMWVPSRRAVQFRPLPANPFAPRIRGRNRTYYGDGLANGGPMKSTRRGNYESGSDYVLEYGELRFTFNERDFTERVEQAAMKLGFVEGQLEEGEREDLVNLAVNGHVENPTSALGEHVNTSWGDLDGPSERSLVHWWRRLVFRGPWLDQR